MFSIGGFCLALVGLMFWRLSQHGVFIVTFLIWVIVILCSQPLIDRPVAMADKLNSLALLQGLDKVTGRVSQFSQEINMPGKFGTLEVIIRACHKTPPEEPPESTAFIEIYETTSEIERQSVFSGWMFSSTPGLSSLEHPVYDIWVLDCIDN